MISVKNSLYVHKYQKRKCIAPFTCRSCTYIEHTHSFHFSSVFSANSCNLTLARKITSPTMKFTPVLACIFLLICAEASRKGKCRNNHQQNDFGLFFFQPDHLMCYSCFYFEDHHTSSDSSCLANPDPSTLQNCTSPVVEG